MLLGEGRPGPRGGSRGGSGGKVHGCERIRCNRMVEKKKVSNSLLVSCTLFLLVGVLTGLALPSLTDMPIGSQIVYVYATQPNANTSMTTSTTISTTPTSTIHAPTSTTSKPTSSITVTSSSSTTTVYNPSYQNITSQYVTNTIPPVQQGAAAGELPEPVWLRLQTFPEA